jgi:GxxExxY protein
MLIDPDAFSHITRPILGAAIEVHRTLGAGLLESTYLTCLRHELTARNLRYVTQRPVPLVYKTLVLDTTYRVDLIVEDQVVVEVKAVATLLPLHRSQTLTYMRITRCPIGLLINFNVARLIDGVKRLIRPATAPDGRGGNGGYGSKRSERSNRGNGDLSGS